MMLTLPQAHSIVQRGIQRRRYGGNFGADLTQTFIPIKARDLHFAVAQSETIPDQPRDLKTTTAPKSRLH